MAPLPAETLAEEATPKRATEVLLPCLIGWLIQFYLSGVTTDRSIRVLRTRNKHKFAITKLARPLFIIASICNALVGIMCIWNIGLYTVSQNRTVGYITSYKLPDVLGLAFGLPTSSCTQIFMAIRCWKVTSRAKPIIGGLLSFFIFVAFAGGFWATVVVGMLQHGSLDDNQRIFTPTVIWLIGNVVADLLITIIFTVHLRRLKKGTTRSSTGSFANSLIRLAFETCAIPLFVTLFSAIMRAISTLSHALAHVATASILFIPSLYILSFIYCVEETAHRKKSLERERACIEAGGPALSPPITGSSQSRTDEKRPEPRYHNNNNNKNKRISTNETHVYPSPARGRYQQSNIVRLNSEHSKSLAGWEPPLVWASTVEQDQSTLPRPSESQSRSYEEEMGISSHHPSNARDLPGCEILLTPVTDKSEPDDHIVPILGHDDPISPDQSRRPSMVHVQIETLQHISTRTDDG